MTRRHEDMWYRLMGYAGGGGSSLGDRQLNWSMEAKPEKGCGIAQ